MDGSLGQECVSNFCRMPQSHGKRHNSFASKMAERSQSLETKRCQYGCFYLHPTCIIRTSTYYHAETRFKGFLVFSVDRELLGNLLKRIKRFLLPVHSGQDYVEMTLPVNTCGKTEVLSDTMNGMYYFPCILNQNRVWANLFLKLHAHGQVDLNPSTKKVL